MESPQFSMLSSLRGDFKAEDLIQPYYKESYRLAIDLLVSGGRDSYQEFLKGERIGSFLSEEELVFITSNARQLPPQDHVEEISVQPCSETSSGTYWPIHSDVDTPDLVLGWPDIQHEKVQTNIDLLFHPPRQNSPTIKEVILKHIQDARQVVAIVMDMFTDVDIFKEVVDASIRGVPVYVLLDDFHLKSFLTTAENQDVKIQQLRNMRVRTVKGQDYTCRSGTKFHGAMEQKFLLVDCQRAIYGSYSFTWSFEKINLSMVQVITGHLVKSYDEEFRTLYARSTVPAELCQPEGLFQPNGQHERQGLTKNASLSPQKFDRRDQLRNTLDTVYRKTCERKLGMIDPDDRYFEEESKNHRPLMENGMIQNQVSKFQSTEAMNFLKRHSYAGERQDGYTPQIIRPRASNWNICRDTGNGTNNFAMDGHSQGPLMYRGHNMRQSYNGNDKQMLSMQQNMPTLENTSRSFMRTMRIESYLQNPDAPFRESSDYLEQFEPQDNASNFMQGRMRSSAVFRSAIPEQMDPNRHINNTNPTAPNSSLHYSSMQWSPNAAENRINNERQGLQVLDSQNNTSYGPGRNSYHSTYASLGRVKGGQIHTKPDILTDNWNKRHSVADPRSNSEYTHETSGHMYGAYTRMQNRSTAGINAHNGGYVSNLKGDQRSVSHYDVKKVTNERNASAPTWQEPPSRTVSAAALTENSTDLNVKSTRMGSQHFLKKSSKKIKSMFNIQGKKEDHVGTVDTPSITLDGSTDTLVDEEETISDGRGRSPESTVGSSSEHQRTCLVGDSLKYSKPRFNTEDHQQPFAPANPMTKSRPLVPEKNMRANLDGASLSKDRGAENRLYSRFEPFCSFEKKQPFRSAHSFGNTQPPEKPKTIVKGEAANEHSFTRPARGHHENKLEKFFQRVGHLMHKNK